MELVVFVVHLGWAYGFGFKMCDGGETFPLPPPPPHPISRLFLLPIVPRALTIVCLFFSLHFIGIPSGRLCGGEKKRGKGGGGAGGL